MNNKAKIIVFCAVLLLVITVLVSTLTLPNDTPGTSDTTSAATSTSSNSTSTTLNDEHVTHTHSFCEWYVIYDATPTENGLSGRHCICGFSENREFSEDGYLARVLFVDKHANDKGDGSYLHPFSSIEQARDCVRRISRNDLDEITVYVNEGEYFTEGLSFNAQDSGKADCPTRYKALGGRVKLNSGISIDVQKFVSAKEYPKIYNRLSKDARDNVLVIDLSLEPYNLSSDDYGRINTVGTYTTADRYKNGLSGELYGELFVNGNRQTLARYPNEGYILTETPVIEGISTSAKKENGDPMGDTFLMDNSLTERVSGWESTSDVWAFGFWQYDWADSSTPIESIDLQSGKITFEYQSFLGIKKGAPYYFYNCLEELDCAGEYDLDRESGLLCYYPDSSFAESSITLSIGTRAVIDINAENISFEGFDVTGTRGNGIVINGNGITIENCEISGIGGSAILANGNDISIISNTVSNIGMDGIAVSGGDRASLTPSNNLVHNNTVHDFAQVYKTYRAGINLHGVGNICSHNELYNSPHLAISYSGNNNVVEYNHIHNVCLETDDAGAIYAGRSWTSYGNHVRYNLIYNLGANGHTPDGIYMDDALSGQYIYGNILINIPKYSIHIGGGRDMVVYGNYIVSPEGTAIRYDARAIKGVLGDTWFSSHVAQSTGDLWLDLYNSPWQSEIWQNKFPQYKEFSNDFSKTDDPNFIPNPAGSHISNNIVYSEFAKVGHIDDEVYKYSNISDNGLFPYLIFKLMYEHVYENEYAEVFGNLLAESIKEFNEIDFGSIGTK